MQTKTSTVRFSIRSKLLLLTIAFLALPYTAYRSLLGLESSLRVNMESSLMDVGNSLAALLSLKEDLLRQDVSKSGQHLFIHDLNQPVNLDGYKDEWIELLDWSNSYQHSGNGSFSYKLILARQGHQLFALFDVHDPDQIYHQPGDLRQLNSDHVSMLFKNNQDELLRYEFAAEGQGKLIPFQLEEYWLHEEDREFFPPDIRKVFITNIHGFWQQTEQGYTLEIAIPWHIVSENTGFIVNDFNEKNAQLTQLATFSDEKSDYLNTLIQESQELNEILGGLGLTETRRIWVLDTLGQVMAVDGSLKNMIEKTPVNLLYEILLPKTYDRFSDELTEASRLEGAEIQSALAGKAETRWRSSEDKKAVILSAAVPIRKNNEVIGLVVVEETSNRIQILKRNAMAKLFNRTLIVFVSVTFLFLLFASHLSFRIRRLSRQSNQAIDEHGRVVNTIKMRPSNDELGELAQNYSNILSRLKQYHEYLEGMAGKLSHELRTPMAVVQSSLENLEMETDAKSRQEYLQRAKLGISQLNHLVSRLSEAARLEQALQSSEFEKIDLCQLLENCVSGYASAFSPTEFQLQTKLNSLKINLAPDLVVQMLDKLVSNAVDFHTEGTSIVIELSKLRGRAVLSVNNQGKVLDESLQSQLFQSMTSSRHKDDSAEPHLGLGLYIVRMIAEFHDGEVRAENLVDESGVAFRVILPIK